MKNILLASALVIAGCSDPAALDPDGGPVVRDDGAIADGGGADSAAPSDAAIAADSGTACEPAPGPMTGDAYCDLFELAIFGSGASREARLSGRVSAGTGCTVVDSVEVLEGGTSVATLPGVGPFASGLERALLARGPAVPAMIDRCTMEDRRFGGFGLIVRGRYDGGTFEAHCADAEGGSRWPPALRITCHDGVDDRALSAYAGVSTSSFGAFSTIDVTIPHGPGGALTSADMRVRVIPATYAPIFGPPPAMTMPYDDDGWEAHVSEGFVSDTSPPTTQIHLSRMGAAFSLDLCPPPRTGTPMPGDPPPPVFLVRITGRGERGAYSTEAYVQYCITTSS